ncbi:MAG: hypothetical protein WBG50_04255 [Desulfomonilaceae bacterium]
MLTTISRRLFFVAGLSMLSFLGLLGHACGQSPYGPSLYGVSYGEMMQWQSRYGGGGFYGCDYPPPRPYCCPGEMQPAPVLKPPYPCRMPRSGRHKGGK